jgi:hypothetical protein
LTGFPRNLTAETFAAVSTAPLRKLVLANDDDEDSSTEVEDVQWCSSEMTVNRHRL